MNKTIKRRDTQKRRGRPRNEKGFRRVRRTRKALIEEQRTIKDPIRHNFCLLHLQVKLAKNSNYQEAIFGNKRWVFSKNHYLIIKMVD